MPDGNVKQLRGKSPQNILDEVQKDIDNGKVHALVMSYLDCDGYIIERSSLMTRATRHHIHVMTESYMMEDLLNTPSETTEHQ